MTNMITAVASLFPEGANVRIPFEVEFHSGFTEADLDGIVREMFPHLGEFGAYGELAAYDAANAAAYAAADTDYQAELKKSKEEQMTKLEELKAADAAYDAAYSAAYATYDAAGLASSLAAAFTAGLAASDAADAAYQAELAKQEETKNDRV
tara:strand:- start:658 stop:1113 length:456 start_codon:yes stop_codon:yes gene_type:complete